MLVGQEDVEEVLQRLSQKDYLALDTETTGLRPFHGDRLFAIQIASSTETYYFDFNAGVGRGPSPLERETTLRAIGEFTRDYRGTWFVHNAKFDLAILDYDAIQLGGKIHCTQITSRILDSHRSSGSLESLAETIGRKKDDRVKQYILENDLWEWEIIPGKKQRKKKMFYDQVPFEIMYEYGCEDAAITFALGMYQLQQLRELDLDQSAKRKVREIYETEAELLQVVYKMEHLGVSVDPAYCQKAIEFEKQRVEQAEREFESITGESYKASGKLFDEIFRESQKDFYVTTEKGNPSFDSSVLQYFTHPAAERILRIRDSKSKSDFYNGFLYHMDRRGNIHANFNQDGTVTGRFSSSDPNLQNLTKEDEEEDKQKEFLIRRAFVPRKDHLFLMVDYKQMEYRLMLDYVGCEKLIAEINNGLDVHEAMAKYTGLPRRIVKNVNFAILYGAGLEKLSKMIGCSEAEAKAAKARVFEAASGLYDFLQTVMRIGKRRGWIVNWAGRRVRCVDPETAYKLPNYLIQGGCADVVKKAMVKIHQFLGPYKSHLLMQIHDELVIELHRDECHLAPRISEIMESIYSCRHLPLTVSVEWSDKSLADKIEGYPVGRETGDEIQEKGAKCS